MPARAPVLRLSIACHMREIRGERRLKEMEAVTRINAGTLSQIENGQRLPRPDHVEALERAYGSSRDWYSVEMLKEE